MQIPTLAQQLLMIAEKSQHTAALKIAADLINFQLEKEVKNDSGNK